MRYLIGGAPRVGKTQLAKAISHKNNIFRLSTDVLRWAAFQLDQVSINDSLFIKKRLGEYDDPEGYYAKYSTEEVVQNEITESKEVAKLARGFVESFSYGEADFILEGVALLPSLLDGEFIDKYDLKHICVGNTDADSFKQYSWERRAEGEWMRDFPKETFDKVIEFCVELSEVYKKEAEDGNVPYYEIRSETFLEDIASITKEILETNGKQLED